MLISSIVTSNTIEEFFVYIKASNYSKAYTVAISEQDPLIKQQLLFYHDLIYKCTFNNEEDLERNYANKSIEHNLMLLNKGLYEYIKDCNEIRAGETLKKAFLLAKERGDTIIAAESLKLSLEIYQRFGSIVGDDSYNYILNEYKNFLYDDFERRNYLLKTLKLKYRSQRNKEADVLSFFYKHRHELEQYNENTKFLNAKIQLEISTIISLIKGDLEQPKKLILNAINNLENIELGIFEKERLIAAKISLAVNLHLQSDFNSVIDILDQLEIANENYMHQLIKPYKLYWLSESHKNLNNELISCQYKNEYYELALINDQSNKAQQNTELETKYQTAEKEKQILVEQQRARTTKLVLGGSIVGILIFSFLIYKNTKRKQHIAEQEKELEVQRTEKVLAEQELTSIQAMIAGQEKERELVAEDLHHGVAGTINAARMQFEHIAKNKDKALEMTELFKKTEALLQQAHEEVRGMAHLKNTGVIATKGLLPAIQNLAKNASSNQGLLVDVQDFGLTERIDNSLEIRIFRTVQELINNVIKHANATEASISLTRHEGSLSIIVEDNGQGFDITHLSEKEGMGLYSMEKHIEQIDGTLHIDSSPGNGTTVLIDIPL